MGDNIINVESWNLVELERIINLLRKQRQSFEVNVCFHVTSLPDLARLANLAKLAMEARDPSAPRLSRGAPEPHRESSAGFFSDNIVAGKLHDKREELKKWECHSTGFAAERRAEIKREIAELEERLNPPLPEVPPEPDAEPDADPQSSDET